MSNLRQPWEKISKGRYYRELYTMDTAAIRLINGCNVFTKESELYGFCWMFAECENGDKYWGALNPINISAEEIYEQLERVKDESITNRSNP
jgi:hypothetical protein